MANDFERGQFPGYHRDYPFMMSDAHRKPAYAIGTPSISWHLSFWQPHDDEAKWIRDIESLILSLYDCFERENCTPTVSNLQRQVRPERTQVVECRVDLLRNSYVNLGSGWEPAGREGDDQKYRRGRYEVVHMEGRWASMPISLRFEVFEEYFMLTSTFDFSREEMKVDPCVDVRHMNLRGALDELCKAANDRFAEIQKKSRRT